MAEWKCPGCGWALKLERTGPWSWTAVCPAPTLVCKRRRVMPEDAVLKP